MEDVHENENEEEVVVFGGRSLRCHAGSCGFVGRGGFCCGHGGEDGGHVLGLQVGGGWLGCPAVTWRPGGPIWSAAVGEGGTGLRSSPSGLGWAAVLQCVRSCGFASAGGISSCGLHPGAGGVGLEFLGCVPLGTHHPV